MITVFFKFNMTLPIFSYLVSLNIPITTAWGEKAWRPARHIKMSCAGPLVSRISFMQEGNRSCTSRGSASPLANKGKNCKCGNFRLLSWLIWVRPVGSWRYCSLLLAPIAFIFTILSAPDLTNYTIFLFPPCHFEYCARVSLRPACKRLERSLTKCGTFMSFALPA